MSSALDTDQVESLIRGLETLRTELKGEAREQLSDREIYESVVCLANTEGGVLLIGVEDDGRVTGARPRHGGSTDPLKLQAAIFNNTAPSINTRISLHTVSGRAVVAVEVDPYPIVCATRDGRCLRRVMGVKGPECLPFYPFEHSSRNSDLGLLDYSSRVIEGSSLADIDPLEIERLRQTIDRLHGDRVLLSLDDVEILKALGLVQTRESDLAPNVAGLLLVGRKEAVQRFLPTHEVAFQVLDREGNVKVNVWDHGPLLKTLEGVEARFMARNQEQEVQMGLLRLPIPDYPLRAFREAVNNAVLHRDYTRRGAVFLQFQPDHLQVSNPGGFPEGITLDNLLVHEPKPRNPCLAAAFRRIGLVETTGRGIDHIYLDQLRYGRPLPDYALSDRDGVRLILRGGEASLEFAAFVYDQNRTGKPLNLDELLVLNHLQQERRIDVPTAGRLSQRGDSQARAVLERLVERGLIEPRGEKRGRVYHLSAAVYRELGSPEGYVRTRGFDAARQEAMVLEYVKAHGRITRGQAAELCNLTEHPAAYLLRRMVNEGKLALKGMGRYAYYVQAV